MAIGNISDPYVSKKELRAAQNAGIGNSFPPDVYNHPIWFTIQLRDYVSLPTPIGGTSKSVPGISGEYINLPMPVSGLQDSFNIGYNSAETGVIGGSAAGVMDIINNPQNVVGIVGGSILSGVSQLTRGIATSGAGALGDVVGIGAEAQASTKLALGAVSNPNLAAVFEGVKLRRHTFSWKLMALNKFESDQISKLVAALKKGALPKKELGSNYALLYPKVAYLFINGNRKNNLVTFSEKGAFIENINVNYMGQNGHPAFFVGTKDPLEVDLTITFLERSIVTDVDVGE